MFPERGGDTPGPAASPPPPRAARQLSAWEHRKATRTPLQGLPGPPRQHPRRTPRPLLYHAPPPPPPPPPPLQSGRSHSVGRQLLLPPSDPPRPPDSPDHPDPQRRLPSGLLPLPRLPSEQVSAPSPRTSTAREGLALSQCEWAHQFGEPELVPAAKSTDLYREASM